MTKLRPFLAGAFDGRPFLAGPMIGLRTMRVRADGVLTGVVHPEYHWSAGENVATCRPRLLPRPHPGHRVAQHGCTCGFYAFHDGRNDYSRKGIEALVECYGTVTLGSRGMRAEKARIVALVWPSRWRKVLRGYDFPDMDAVRATYPDIPIYRSRRVALRAHPLTRPTRAEVDE